MGLEMVLNTVCILLYLPLSILSTAAMLIPALIYFANANASTFFAYFAWMAMGLEMVLNTVCILLYLPLSIRLYHRICCGMERLCDAVVITAMKRRIVENMRGSATSEFSSDPRNAADSENSHERSQ